MLKSKKPGSITITIPSYFLYALLAFPLLMQWTDGFFFSLGIFTAYVIVFFQIVFTSIFVIAFFNNKVTYNPKPHDKTDFSYIAHAAVTFLLIYLLGEHNMAIISIICSFTVYFLGKISPASH